MVNLGRATPINSTASKRQHSNVAASPLPPRPQATQQHLLQNLIIPEGAVLFSPRLKEYTRSETLFSMFMAFLGAPALFIAVFSLLLSSPFSKRFLVATTAAIRRKKKLALPKLYWTQPLSWGRYLWARATWMRPRPLVGRFALIAYFLWYLLCDRQTSRRGGRPWQWLRQHSLWARVRAYFPATCLRLAPVPASEGPYVIAAHPHGLISLGTWMHIISDNNVFPDLNYRVLTISANFIAPIYRDVVMGLGFVDASHESCSYMLKNHISVAVVVGGAEESLDARPGNNDLTLSRRLGFVRLALENGAKLVPVFTFGETDLFHQLVPNPPGSLTRKIQEAMLRVTGFTIPLVAPNRFGLPRKRPILTVVGRPLAVPKCSQPPPLDVILKTHARYVQALQELYDEYKDVAYASSRMVPELDIVDRLRRRDVRKITAKL